MPKEIEVKVRFGDFAALRERLTTAGAVRDRAELELNIFMDTSDGVLRAAGSGLRVRIAVDEAGVERCRLTFKGPASEEEVRSREELEVEISDGDVIQVLLEKLGFEQKLSFEKRRETWHFGETEVVLDELPLLGSFVEVEGPSKQVIGEALLALGLENEQRVRRGYAPMMGEKLKELGSDNRYVRFE